MSSTNSSHTTSYSPVNEDFLDKLATNARIFNGSSSPHSKKKLKNFKPECIREESDEENINALENTITNSNESSNSSLNNCNRVRKKTHRLFTTFNSIGISAASEDANLFQYEGGSSSLVPNSKIENHLASINPEINIEKTLGSTDMDAMMLESPNSRNHSEKNGNKDFDCLSPDDNNPYNRLRTRKMSLPTLPVTLGIPTPMTRDRSFSPARCRPKLSSKAVSEVRRKISTTIGWRSPTTDEVVPQAKYICSQYIRSRLKRAGLLSKKLGLRRLRSLANLAGGVEVCEVFPRISCLGHEMERSHPTVYGSVVRQLAVALRSEKIVRHLMMAISSDLLTVDLCWARIISLYAIASTLAVDCVKQGHPEYIDTVIEGVGYAIEQYSLQWIVRQGGWSGIISWSQPPACELSPLEMMAIITGAGVLLAAILGGAISMIAHLIA